MNFEFSTEQNELKRSAVRFAREVLADDVIGRDRAAVFSRELWEKCADYGILGFSFPEQYGGNGADIVSTMLLMEGLGYGCRDSGLLFAINGQMWSVQMPILNFGSDEQKNRYLPKLCRGEWIGADSITEPDSGSDAYSLRTTATLDGGEYVLNGTKTFCTMAPEADVFVVFATVDRRKGFMGVTAFIVERDCPGFTVGKGIEKMGLRTAPFARAGLRGLPDSRSATGWAGKATAQRFSMTSSSGSEGASWPASSAGWRDSSNSAFAMPGRGSNSESPSGRTSPSRTASST